MDSPASPVTVMLAETSRAIGRPPARATAVVTTKARAAERTTVKIWRYEWFGAKTVAFAFVAARPRFVLCFF